MSPKTSVSRNTGENEQWVTC